MKVLETDSTFKCGSEISRTMPRRLVVAIFLGKFDFSKYFSSKKHLAKMSVWLGDFCGSFSLFSEVHTRRITFIKTQFAISGSWSLEFSFWCAITGTIVIVYGQ